MPTAQGLALAAGSPGSAAELSFPWCCACLVTGSTGSTVPRSNTKQASLSCVLPWCYPSPSCVHIRVKEGLERDVGVRCATKGNEHQGLFLKFFSWIWK